MVIPFAATKHHDYTPSMLFHRIRQLRYVSSTRQNSADVAAQFKEMNTKMIRLSKRMGELDLFSRREADRLIQNGRVLVDGEVVEIGHKVPSDLRVDRIEVINVVDCASSHQGQKRVMIRENALTAVILNKPKGYVSGQAEHGHPPAIRLLISRNRIWEKNNSEKETNSDQRDNTVFKRDDDNREHFSYWKGFAPAGRLDLDSTGLLIFTKNGVLAKKLIGASSSVEKEYIVDVEPAMHPTKRELAIDPNFVLPSQSDNQQSFDLSRILQGGGFLLGDNRPLKPCSKARWITKGKRLQIVLTEGRKHHIRRLCRELLGFHVVGLQRVRIGTIELPPAHILPEGCWRPLHRAEIECLLADSRQ